LRWANRLHYGDKTYLFFPITRVQLGNNL
jgi:hypothetical protein